MVRRISTIKSLAALAVFLAYVSLILIARANFRPTASCGLYFGTGSTLGLDTLRDTQLTVYINSGTLNSSTSYLENIVDEGYLFFNSSESGTLIISFEGLNVDTYINGSRTGQSINSETTLAFGISDNVLIDWDWGIVDLTEIYTMPFIGLSGMVLLCFGAFAGALQVRNFSNESSDSLFMLGIYFVIAIIGAALIVVWLWP